MFWWIGIFGQRRTRGKGLLQLLGLVLVLEDEGVEVALAADLELDLLRRGLLDAHSCKLTSSVNQYSRLGSGRISFNAQEASLRRQISMNCLMSRTWEGILAGLSGAIGVQMLAVLCPPATSCSGLATRSCCLHLN